jgi:hypothetical protein
MLHHPRAQMSVAVVERLKNQAPRFAAPPSRILALGGDRVARVPLTTLLIDLVRAGNM